MVKVPGSTQIISKLEADGTVQVLGGLDGSKVEVVVLLGVLFEEVSEELLEPLEGLLESEDVEELENLNNSTGVSWGLDALGPNCPPPFDPNPQRVPSSVVKTVKPMPQDTLFTPDSIILTGLVLSACCPPL